MGSLDGAEDRQKRMTPLIYCPCVFATDISFSWKVFLLPLHGQALPILPSQMSPLPQVLDPSVESSSSFPGHLARIFATDQCPTASQYICICPHETRSVQGLWLMLLLPSLRLARCLAHSEFIICVCEMNESKGLLLVSFRGRCLGSSPILSFDFPAPGF